MAKKNVKQVKQENTEQARIDPGIKFREECLQKVIKEGYEAAYDGSVLMIYLSKKDYCKEEIREKAKEAIKSTGYNASFGVKQKA